MDSTDSTRGPSRHSSSAPVPIIPEAPKSTVLMRARVTGEVARSAMVHMGASAPCTQVYTLEEWHVVSEAPVDRICTDLRSGRRSAYGSHPARVHRSHGTYPCKERAAAHYARRSGTGRRDGRAQGGRSDLRAGSRRLPHLRSRE